jgi:hypothetical protein
MSPAQSRKVERKPCVVAFTSASLIGRRLRCPPRGIPFDDSSAAQRKSRNRTSSMMRSAVNTPVTNSDCGSVWISYKPCWETGLARSS